MFEILLFGFTQGLVVGPVTLFGIHEGLEKKKGFLAQMQVLIGSSLVDFIYILLATYGAASLIDHFYVRLVMWLIASYMLIMMGVNTFHDRKKRLHVENLHGHKRKFLEMDFVRGFLLTIFNPLAIVFWIMVAGGLYADSKNLLSPWLFAVTVTVSSLVTATIIAILTLVIKKMVHAVFLKRIMLLSSLILIGYGIWFYLRASFEVSRFVFGL